MELNHDGCMFFFLFLFLFFLGGGGGEGGGVIWPLEISGQKITICLICNFT